MTVLIMLMNVPATAVKTINRDPLGVMKPIGIRPIKDKTIID